MKTLFYVIGASGVGKDSLLALARQEFEGGAIAFAHRYVTRPVTDSSENFISLTPTEFAVRSKRQLFWLSWSSHDLHYGVGVEVLSWFDAGLTVVVNGSRAVLPEVEAACAIQGIRCEPIWVVCSSETLAKRLRQRGRETESQIEERLRRATAFSPPAGAKIVDNSGTLDAALAQCRPWLAEAMTA